MIWAIHWEKWGGGGGGKVKVAEREYRWSAVTVKSQNVPSGALTLGSKISAQADVSETLTHYKQTQHEYKHQRWSIPQISKLTFEMIFRDNYHVVTYNNSHSQTFDYQQ